MKINNFVDVYISLFQLKSCQGAFNPRFICSIWQWPIGHFLCRNAELITAQVNFHLPNRQAKLRKRVWRWLWEIERDILLWEIVGTVVWCVSGDEEEQQIFWWEGFWNHITGEVIIQQTYHSSMVYIVQLTEVIKYWWLKNGVGRTTTGIEWDTKF